MEHNNHNTQILSKRGLLLFVNKKNPDRFIVVLGTMHLGMPVFGIDRYSYFMDKILQVGTKNVVLRPEACLSTFTFRIIIDRLFSSKIAESSYSMKMTFSSYRKSLKSDEGKKKFDNIMNRYDIKDTSQRIIMYLYGTFYRHLKHFNKMDLEIMDNFKSRIKCKSLDNYITAPFWEKNVREYFKSKKENKKKESEKKNEMDMINELEKDIKKVNDPNLMSKKLNALDKDNSFNYLKLDKRNKIWKKKLTDEKTPIQIALVGWAHLRAGENSLKKLFQKDDNWDVYDFKDFDTDGIYTFEDMFDFVVRGLQKTRPSDILRICEGTQKSGQWENHRFTDNPRIDTINVNVRTKPLYLGNFVNYDFKNKRYKIISARNCPHFLFFDIVNFTQNKKVDIQLNEKFWKKVYTLLKDEGQFVMDNFSLFTTKQLKHPFKGLEFIDIFMKKLNAIEGVNFKLTRRSENSEKIVLKKV